MKFLLYILFTILCFIGSAQPRISPPDLMALVENKKNFEEIWAIVTAYIGQKRAVAVTNDEKAFINKLDKHWYRWYLFNRTRLNSRGEITNVPEANLQALQQIPATQRIDATGNAQWALVGPTDRIRTGSGHNSGLGRVNCIAFHPTNANYLYIGTPAGGMWRSTNGGTTWVPMTDMLPSLGVNGIVVDYSNTNRIYILTGDGDGGNMASIGVLVSNDGGTTWQQTGNFPGVVDKSYHGCKLLQHPTNPNILVAATTAGIFRSLNGGGVWINEISGDFTDIEFKPGDPTIMYAARRNSGTPFYRSTNTGDTWSTAGITGVPNNATRIAIGVSPANVNYVYLLAGPATGNGTFVGVFRSFDSGLDFDPKATEPNILGYDNAGLDDAHQTNYDLAVEVSRTDVAIVTTGGINLWTSTSFGNDGTFVRRTQWYDDAPGEYVHADIHNLACNPLNNRLYVCSDGGVSYSDNNGLNWIRLWTSMTTMQFYHMTGNAANADLLLGGTQDNGTNYRKSNTSVFHHIEGADGYSSIIDWSNTNQCFFSENGGLNATSDGGATAYGITPPGSDGCWPMVVQHPFNDDTIYAGKCNAVWKSANKGGTWASTSAGGSSNLVIAPTNGRRLYAVQGSAVRRTETGGTSWVSVTTKPGYPTGAQVTDIDFSPNTSSTNILCTGGFTAGQKVYRSVDFGENWTNISYNLPNAPTGAIAMDVNGNIYVGMDLGIFVLKSGQTQWTPFYNFLPKTPVTDFIINNTAGVIRAATYGRGVWSTELFGACPTDLTLINNYVLNQRYWQASNSITSQQVISTTEGGQVFYSSGNYIDLKENFQALDGSLFKAYISPCDNGIPSAAPLNREYKIENKQELIHTPLLCTDSLPQAGTSMVVAQNNQGKHNVELRLSEPAFITFYAERVGDGEVINLILKAPIKAGAYNMVLDFEKLKNKGIVLKWKVGKSGGGLLPL